MRACKLNPICIDYELASHKKNNHEILFCLILILDDNCMFPDVDEEADKIQFYDC